MYFIFNLENKNLIEKLLSSLDKNANQIAIEESERDYTYKELKEQILFLSTLLNNKQIKRVCVMGEPSFITASSLLSALISQASYVPIDPSWPLNRINFILKDSESTVLISNPLDLKKHSLNVQNFQIPYFLLIEKEKKSHSIIEYFKTKKKIKYRFSNESIIKEALYDTAKISSLSEVVEESGTAEQSETEEIIKPNFKKEPLLKKFINEDKLNFSFKGKDNSSLAYIMYTSGSSGKPKGVEVKLKALDKFLTWIEEEFQVSTEDRFSYTSSLGFGSSVRQIFSPVLSGSTMVCFPQSLLKAPKKILEELSNKKISLFNAPPILLQKIAETAQKEQLNKKCLSSVRLVWAGGDLFPVKIKELWFDQFQHSHELVNLYGSTESIVNASSYSLSHSNIARDSRFHGNEGHKTIGNEGHKYLPIGKARSGLEFLLLDKDKQKITKTNEIGELCIQSAFIAQSYHNNKEKSEKTFKPSKKPEEIIYQTGDRALKLNDGNYLVLGRADKQIQIYGQRLELGEIENNLNRAPNVKRAFVVYIEEDLNKICAFVQTEKYNEKKLRDFLKKEVPSYMIPHFFYKIEQTPLSSTGKLDYKHLKELAKQNILDEDIDLQKNNGAKREIIINNRQQSFIENSQIEDLETEIKKLWEKYLNRKDFSNTDSFFDVGGDSILAVNLYQDLCDQFDIFLDPYIFYRLPNIEKIAKAVKKAQEEKIKKNLNFVSDFKKTEQEKSNPPISFKLIFLRVILKIVKYFNKISSLFYHKDYLKKENQSPQQKYFVFIKRIFNELYNGYFSVPIYFIPNKTQKDLSQLEVFKLDSSFPVSKKFNKEEFKKALNLVIKHQESLRTVFVGEDQLVLPEFPLDLRIYDLTSQNQEEQQKTIYKIENEMLRYSFAISNLPLFKINLLELSEGKAHFIFCINHLIGDGWSLQSFLIFLNDCYAFLNNKQKNLYLHSYIDYTKKYKAFCRKSFHANKMYWDKKILDYNTYNLSEKIKHESEKSFEESLSLKTDILENIKTYCKNNKIQLFDFFLFLWSKSLKEFLACEKICFFTTYHGRDFPLKNMPSLIGSIARLAPIFVDIQLKNIQKDLPLLKDVYLESLKHKDYNIFKTLFSRQSQSNSAIGFNYLDFQNLSHIKTDLPFVMDWDSAKVHLSSNKKAYQKLYLFLSIHSYPNRIVFKLYGRSELKKELLEIMKKNIETIIG